MQLNLFGFENIKKCCECRKILKINNFNKRLNGYQNNCKNCSKKLALNNYYNRIKRNPEYNKIYHQKHKIKRNKYNAIYKKNKRKNNKLFKFKDNVRLMVRNSFSRTKTYKNTSTYKILGCNYDYLKEYIENQFTDNMSWDNFDKIHIDHKIPIAAASTEFEVIALNHYTNLQPLWAEDNIRKSDKYDPEDFKRYMEWYRKNIKTDA